jgi:Cys-rich repeat protein
VVIPVVGIIVACGEDTSVVACKVDRDCPTGNICRSGYCGQTNPDAGIDAADPSLSTEAATNCTADGLTCALATECCGGTCNQGTCSSVAVTTPACKNVYELCVNDCCDGLTCTNGSCR